MGLGAFVDIVRCGFDCRLCGGEFGELILFKLILVCRLVLPTTPGDGDVYARCEATVTPGAPVEESGGDRLFGADGWAGEAGELMTGKLGPYELNTIITGDARGLAEAIPDNSVDLIFTDPPYWVGYDYGYAKDNEIDYIEPIWIVEQSLRIGKICLITPGNDRQHIYPKPDWTMVWRKGNSMKRYKWGFCHWEPILAYGEPNLPQSKMRPDVYDAPIVVNQFYDGKTPPKPLKLMLDLITTFTESNQLIVDFCCGTGTTCQAAKMLGRNYLAFEIDPATADAARERVLLTQPPLFVPEPEQLELIGESEVIA